MARQLNAYHCHNGTYTYMVAAFNMKEAAIKLGCSVGQIRQYGGKYIDPDTINLARSQPGRVFKRLIVGPRGQTNLDWVYADGGRSP